MRMSPWPPLLTALTIWFAHFMTCWAASELVWPHQRMANVFAWAATAIALLALGMHALRLRGLLAAGELTVWHYGCSQGAAALATVAVVFSALPAILLMS